MKGSEGKNRLEDELTVKARPFLKWAGGKNQLLQDILPLVPQTFKVYHEPFLGGGALFFALSPAKAVLSDINSELINTYKTVQANLEALIENLKIHEASEEYYYRLRNLDRSLNFFLLNEIERASRLIYLNKSCYNGLYRVNSKGHFNTPYGKYECPKILDEENLIACNQALRNTELISTHFARVLEAKEGDFVYLDPPYLPLTATANFTAYAKGGFGFEMHQQLLDVCQQLTKKKVKFILSNSSNKVIVELFSEFDLRFVEAQRAVNSKGALRGAVQEILVKNF